MRVRVYYNLNKSVWSVQHYISGKGWRVREHLTSLILEDVTFKVYEAGRQRVIANERKNVHAFAIGELVQRTDYAVWCGNTQAVYNPYRAACFMSTATHQRVDSTSRAVFKSDRRVYIPNRS